MFFEYAFGSSTGMHSRGELVLKTLCKFVLESADGALNKVLGQVVLKLCYELEPKASLEVFEALRPCFDLKG